MSHEMKPPPVPKEPGSLEGALVGGRYVVGRRIGRGGMGTVHAARQTTLNREVAIKFLNVGDRLTPAVVQRFEQEARLVASLRHPNIVDMYEYGTHEGIPYMVMEYVEGSTLSARLKEAGAFSAAEAVSIVRQTLDALALAHAHKIVHRDLKTENLMLVSRGLSRDIVKVLDFGIAKILAEDELGEEERFTRTGLILGSPKTMPPEQIAGERVDHRADIYSLGVIFYRLLAMKYPFLGADPMAVLYKHVNEAPPQLGRDVCPKALWPVLRKAMAKAPDDRYQSAEAMAADLDRVARSLDLTGRTREEPLVATPRRMKPAAVALGGLAALLAGAALWYGLGREQAAGPAPPESGAALSGAPRPETGPGGAPSGEAITIKASTAPETRGAPAAAPAGPDIAPQVVPSAEPAAAPLVDPPPAPQPAAVALVHIDLHTVPTQLDVLAADARDDGPSMGLTPLVLNVPAAALPYSVRFRLGTTVTAPMPLRVADGAQEARLTIDLSPVFTDDAPTQGSASAAKAAGPLSESALQGRRSGRGRQGGPSMVAPAPPASDAQPQPSEQREPGLPPRRETEVPVVGSGTFSVPAVGDDSKTSKVPGEEPSVPAL
ncbi:MAG: hypothetical protein AMXMBFR64_01070 [Myxococcales bacterium]